MPICQKECDDSEHLLDAGIAPFLINEYVYTYNELLKLMKGFRLIKIPDFHPVVA